jgi:hypothetical protein
MSIDYCSWFCLVLFLVVVLYRALCLFLVVMELLLIILNMLRVAKDNVHILLQPVVDLLRCYIYILLEPTRLF